MDITKRELAALTTAIVYEWDLEVSPRGVACWDGDRLLPFKAFASLESLVRKGLMRELPSPPFGWRYYRATPEATAFRCKAVGCQRGWVYEDDDGYSRRSRKCDACGGKGAVLTPNT